MSDDLEFLENELYAPIRKISHRIPISNPDFKKEMLNLVENFSTRHPGIYNSGELYERVVAHLYGYLLGRETERENLEIIRLGVDGIKFVVSSYLKYKELGLKERGNKDK